MSKSLNKRSNIPRDLESLAFRCLELCHVDNCDIFSCPLEHPDCANQLNPITACLWEVGWEILGNFDDEKLLYSLKLLSKILEHHFREYIIGDEALQLIIKITDFLYYDIILPRKEAEKDE